MILHKPVNQSSLSRYIISLGILTIQVSTCTLQIQVLLRKISFEVCLELQKVTQNECSEHGSFNNMRSEVLILVKTPMSVSYIEMHCGLEGTNQNFAGTYSLQLQGWSTEVVGSMFFKITDIYLEDQCLHLHHVTIENPILLLFTFVTTFLMCIYCLIQITSFFVCSRD